MRKLCLAKKHLVWVLVLRKVLRVMSVEYRDRERKFIRDRAYEFWELQTNKPRNPTECTHSFCLMLYITIFISALWKLWKMEFSIEGESYWTEPPCLYITKESLVEICRHRSKYMESENCLCIFYFVSGILITRNNILIFVLLCRLLNYSTWKEKKNCNATMQGCAHFLLFRSFNLKAPL